LRSRSIARLLLLQAVLLFVLGWLVSPASAATGRTPTSSPLKLDVRGNGHSVHIMPTPAAYAHARRQAFQDGTVFDSTSPLVKGSGPIMKDPTNYLIFWQPSGSNTTFGAGYEAAIQRYFHDVQGPTPFLNIITQYDGTNGSPTNTSHYGDTWIDTNAYPAPDDGTTAHPLTDGDIQTAVNDAITANPTWQAPGLNTMYFVFTGKFDGTSEPIHSCMGSDCFAGQPTSDNANPGYCAYHGVFGSPDHVYASQPYDPLGACYPSSYNGGPYPNGADGADITITAVSHEQFEAYTDPELSNWRDSTGDEIGDKCAYHFPWGDPNAGPFEPDGTDIVLNSNPYFLQTEWSNAAVVWNQEQPPGQNPAAPGCVKRDGQDSDQSVVPSSVDFGTVNGNHSANRTITITNTGLGDMNILDIRLGAGSSSHFTLPAVQNHQTLSPGSSTNITVHFASPVFSPGTYTGSVIVDYDDPQPRFTSTIPIQAFAGDPNATLNTSSLNFGGVATDNRTSPNTVTRTVILSNTGTADLTLNSLTTTNADFQASSPVSLPATIAPGSSITLSVDFNPSAPGSDAGTLFVNTDDPANPTLSVSLTGTGLLPGITFAPSSLVFAPTVLTTQVPGYTGSMLNFSVMNTGQAELIVDSQSTSGAPFSVPAADSPPDRFGPNMGYTLPVTFAPTATGKFTGTVTVADNGSGEGPVSRSANVCGEGVNRGIRVLVVNGSGVPYANVSKLKLSSHNTSTNVNINVSNLALSTVPNSCISGQQEQYENQSLPAAPGGSNNHASYYTLSISVGGKSSTMDFTLQPAEFKELVVTVK
jgi:HYDIN/CFA65/VesB family protein